jgi:translation initiation factor 4B
VGSLPYDTAEPQIYEFFKDVGAEVTEIRLVTDSQDGRSKGFGYVEFDSLDSLKLALEQNDRDFHGRPIRVDVADKRKSDRGPRTADNGLRSNQYSGGDGDEKWSRRPAPVRRDHRDAPQERPPIGTPLPEDAERPKREKKKPAIDPFGGAKPADTASIQKKLLELRRKEEEEERKARESAKQESDTVVEKDEPNDGWTKHQNRRAGRQQGRGKGRGGNNYRPQYRTDAPAWERGKGQTRQQGRRNQKNNASKPAAAAAKTNTPQTSNASTKPTPVPETKSSSIHSNNAFAALAEESA